MTRDDAFHVNISLELLLMMFDLVLWHVDAPDVTQLHNRVILPTDNHCIVVRMNSIKLDMTYTVTSLFSMSQLA
jgi:hypothetical protein